MLKVDIVTPKGIVYTEEVESVNIPAYDGEMGILENHMLLLTQIKPGLVYFNKDDKNGIAVGYGFADITPDKVIILTEEAVPVGNIDLEEYKKVFEEATRKLSDARTAEEISEWQKKREMAETFINIAKHFSPKIKA
ncbi:ATP synthase F1, epsilon subunit [Hydrogenobaculum sp. Y04AAS1]|uniref:ATP synthase epsilon chain n=1 Tax=Hydrogenobaculum sp. (strain Y04AAS1) TaxID=380749 RepID=ATPE_HYDS0|nr:RecName: Full=ATP synthase epsilon chain; AltName: Full=ATP synthase F1 sector epsilon subunit; AltName: Full=F-ATPase epsilon subunit [Hydrogenobaculum sp. Y04AAS1]ACG57773.1 ATP synthase F1, epsilon subunit [Hydrogenobaculum sp. Y04AAS1]HCT66337.1 ATP synthase epsilon chain [Hydrogenobaculum sp.]